MSLTEPGGAVHIIEDCDVYQINASYVGLDNVTVNNGTIAVNSDSNNLAAADVSATYKVDKIIDY